MVGASGTFNNLRYLHSTDNPGIYDSKSSAGSVFYNRRLSKRNYIGGTYQYSEIMAYPPKCKK